MPMLIAAFYRFADLADYRELRQPLEALCRARDIRGTILLAPEGVNGTIAGRRQDVEAILAKLRGHPQLSELEHKESHAEAQPFHRLKVRLKREIITFGADPVDPTRSGTPVAAKDWNRLIADPDVLVIDTRNGYEVAAGSFKHAVNPDTAHFSDFPRYVKEQLDPKRHKRVAMFCTGGIRCEKASGYLLEQGFAEVYQLQGGILKYLEEVPAQESLWQGECFVFDQRVTVTHGLAPGTYTSCGGCRHSLSPADRAAPEYREGIQCPHCSGRRSERQLSAARERYRQVQIAARRGRQHIGAAIGSNQDSAATAVSDGSSQ
jgi:UPF0176 protein